MLQHISRLFYSNANCLKGRQTASPRNRGKIPDFGVRLAGLKLLMSAQGLRSERSSFDAGLDNGGSRFLIPPTPNPDSEHGTHRQKEVRQVLA
jgi:hypothetical protein